MIKKIRSLDFKKFLKRKIDKDFEKKIKNENLLYKEMSLRHQYDAINKIIKIIYDKKFIKAGHNYKIKWEKGWGKNLKKYLKNLKNIELIPEYSDKYKFYRINNRLVKTITKNFDIKILRLILYFFFKKYLSKEKSIVDFGCGTGHNIIFLNKYTKKKYFMV